MEYSKVLKEVYEILKNSEDKIQKKIPIKFYTFLKENMDTDYQVNIDYSKENWEDELCDDTKGILALIYRDYLVDSKTREELIKLEKEEEKKQKLIKEKQYNVDDIFKRNKYDDETFNKEKDKPKEIISINKIPWYRKIYNKIIKYLKKYNVIKMYYIII